MKIIWDHSKSLRLSQLSVKCAFVFWCGLFVLFYPLLLWYQYYFQSVNHLAVIVAIFYSLFVPMSIILYRMMKLLDNISEGRIFCQENIQHLRIVSWGCFFGGIVLLLGGLVEFVCFLGAGLIGFFGLLMRVVKNILSEAIILKEENDFTI